jgi:hypothetical protein
MSRWSWLAIRCSLVAVSAIAAGWTLPDEEPTTFESGSLTGLGIVSVGALLGTVLLVGMQAANPSSAKVWARPSWKLSPLDLKQPLVMLHFYATVVLAVAVGGAAAALWPGGGSDLGGAAFFGAVGLAMRLGVAISGVLFGGKTRAAEETDKGQFRGLGCSPSMDSKNRHSRLTDPRSWLRPPLQKWTLMAIAFIIWCVIVLLRGQG